ncbi:hypothetical protein FRACA_1920004 [Frankia canadensis]|uniref:Uncharacterized protein n=1 Tax=Frankia canadensis TaxID=1836972 RepID=A0A2I2KPB4_9ACTN|nr:hypothetical protein FRACA_1920004 [Frankia canadensis]SOU54798.1 hypothetical protein FRACA_1920004 [Frankia canadensis]
MTQQPRTGTVEADPLPQGSPGGPGTVEADPLPPVVPIVPGGWWWSQVFS